MPISDQIAAARAAYFERPTKIDVRPEGKDSFFGADGLSFRDALDAINPLNHIPIVSDLFENLTGHEASTGSKLIGGTLLGGPIGFVASLAGVIYKNETGESVVGTAYAAITGDESVAVASAEQSEDQPERLGALESEEETEVSAEIATAVPNPDMQKLIESLDPATQAALKAASSQPPIEDAPEQSTSKPKPTAALATPASANTVLELYGASPASAHSSYRSAQLRPYLEDVTVSKVL